MASTGAHGSGRRVEVELVGAARRPRNDDGGAPWRWRTTAVEV
jgi:hypothetical protein